MWTEFADPDCRTGRQDGHAGRSARRARLAGRRGAGVTRSQRTWPAVVSPIARLSFSASRRIEGNVPRRGNPVFSMDSKAKEHLGQLSKGRVWTRPGVSHIRPRLPSWATGLVIPHGIYDLACALRPHQHRPEPRHEPIRLRQLPLVLEPHRQAACPDATSILLACGGSNAANQYLFKQDLQELVNAIGIEIRGTIRATARSTTRSNAVFPRPSVRAARACCSTRWTRSSA